MTNRLIDADDLAQWLDTAASNTDGAEATAYQRIARLVRTHADRVSRCPSCHTEPDRPHSDYCHAPVCTDAGCDHEYEHQCDTTCRHTHPVPLTVCHCPPCTGMAGHGPMGETVHHGWCPRHG